MKKAYCDVCGKEADDNIYFSDSTPAEHFGDENYTKNILINIY